MINLRFLAIASIVKDDFAFISLAVAYLFLVARDGFIKCFVRLSGAAKSIGALDGLQKRPSR